MKQKNIILIILFIVLSGCGYTPIYSTVGKIDFNLNVIKITGDNEMNNAVLTQIKKYSNPSPSRTFNININTEYYNTILVRNKKGKAKSYSIQTKIEFEIIQDGKKKVMFYDDETIAFEMNNEFEFKKYETSIKNNFINLKLDEFILELSKIQ